MENIFIVIVVCLNPGEKLKKTISSVVEQTDSGYEIILKDGGSTDGAVEALHLHALEHGYADRLHIFRKKDSGIYDAMNQAVRYAVELFGDRKDIQTFLLFLNCGDTLYNAKVLESIGTEIQKKSHPASERFIVYGDRYLETTKQTEVSPPKITAFQCYRNIPCHQVCIYSMNCFSEHLYELKYRVRADYEHFLWCFFQGGAAFLHLELCVARYEGGGFSEANGRRSASEHREIARKYYTPAQRFWYKAFLILSLQPLRKRLASTPAFAKTYNRVVAGLYRHQGTGDNPRGIQI